MKWLRKWAGLLFAAIATVLLTILTGGWYLRRKNDQLAKARDEATIAKAQSEIGRLEAIKSAVAERVGEKDEAIAALDLQIREQKLRVLDVGEGIGDMSDEDLEAAFKRALGP